MKRANELIDLDLALGHAFPVVSTIHDERDVALYALGVGAGTDPCDETDLPYVYELHESGFRALPTYGVIPAVNTILRFMKDGLQAPGLHYGLDRTLHGEQLTDIRRPMPTRGTLTHHARIKNIFDKGKNALIVTEIRSLDEAGDEIVFNEVTTFVRGAGGFGGERGPDAKSESVALPGRAPDAVTTQKIPASQALLYRLSGDWNPLHADPAFAAKLGAPRPILHGLCTYGYAGRHVLRAFAAGDAARFRSIKVRFSDSLYPGETLRTEMWDEGDGRIVFQCVVEERDKVVISNATVQLTRSTRDA